MTFIGQDHAAPGWARSERPLWLPHPALIGFIALLWGLAGTLEAVSWLHV